MKNDVGVQRLVVSVLLINCKTYQGFSEIKNTINSIFNIKQNKYRFEFKV